MKRYNFQSNIGTVKYVVNFCTGDQFNRDGSMSWDIRLFSNLRKRDKFVRELESQGYERG